MEVPRNPASLTVNRMLELNQHLVLAIYNLTLRSQCDIGQTLLYFVLGYEKLHNISFKEYGNSHQLLVRGFQASKKKKW